MLCPKCGAIVSDESIFCEKCGEKVVVSINDVRKQDNVSGKDFWIDNLRAFARLTFLGCIISGMIIGYLVSGGGRDRILFIVIIAIGVIVGTISIGFIMVFLNMATDIRIIREYLIKDQPKK